MNQDNLRTVSDVICYLEANSPQSVNFTDRKLCTFLAKCSARDLEKIRNSLGYETTSRELVEYYETRLNIGSQVSINALVYAVKAVLNRNDLKDDHIKYTLGRWDADEFTATMERNILKTPEVMTYIQEKCFPILLTRDAYDIKMVLEWFIVRFSRDNECICQPYYPAIPTIKKLSLDKSLGVRHTARIAYFSIKEFFSTVY